MVYDGYLLRLNSKHQLVLYVLHPCRLVLMEKYCNRTFEKQGSGILWMILLQIKINTFMVRYYQEQNKTEKMWRIFASSMVEKKISSSQSSVASIAMQLAG